MNQPALASARPSTVKRPWLGQLWAQVLLAMIAGILLGVLRPELAGRMQPLGDGFIRAIRMLIAPIVFCSVVHGVARMADMARVGRTALKALVYFEILTTLALIVGLVMVNVLRPGAGMNVDLSHLDASAVQSYVSSAQDQTPVAFLMNIIPQTVVGAFAEVERQLREVLLISVLFGFALDPPGPCRETAARFRRGCFARMVFGAVGIVMYLAPIGAFGAIAFTVGKFGARLAGLPGKTAGHVLRDVPGVRVRSAGGPSAPGADFD